MMRPKDRQIKIIDTIRQQGRASVDELVHRFETSPETIRRDLSFLAESGKLQKVHGGAVLSRVTGESTFRERIGENVKAKRSIAKSAAALVSSGETIFIDTGSTTLNFAEEITTIDNLTVITNSTKIAEIICAHDSSNRVFLVGGEFDADNRETHGALAITQLQAFQAQHAVLTVGALDASAGAMDFNMSEAQVARTMIEQSETLIVLVDASKFNRIASFKVCALDEIDRLVCDSCPDQVLADSLSRNQVQVVCNEY